MSQKVLVDTNIVIAYFNGNVEIKNYLDQLEEILIPTIVIGELYFGAEKSARRTQNLQQVDHFILANVVLGSNAQTGRYFGMIKHQLTKIGRPIPDNDIWIAAIAIQHDLTLVSRDAHFNQIEGLALDRWI